MPKDSLSLNDNARKVLAERYQRPGESAEDLFWRVAKAIAKAEPEDKQEQQAQAFFDLMSSTKFLPNSPTLVNAGLDGRGCLSACFVVSPEDSMESIMQTVSDWAMIEKWGGGVGLGLANIRPKGSPIATTHGKALGPIAIVKMLSFNAEQITQGSFRLGAHMAMMPVSHPNVQEFIHLKDDDKSISNFNISVQLTDAFMEAVKSDSAWNLVAPHNGSVVETVSARDLWNELCESAWRTGDPGVAFIDRVWETQPNPQLGNIIASNPCVVGSTRIATLEGLLPISELVDKSVEVLTMFDGIPKFLPASKVSLTRKQSQVLKVTTKHGYNVTCTPDHIFYVGGEQKQVKASDLQIGAALIVQSCGAFSTNYSLPAYVPPPSKRYPKGIIRKAFNPPTQWSKEVAEVLGFCVGDGGYIGNGKIISLNFGGWKAELLPYFQAILSAISGTSGCDHTTATERRLNYSGSTVHFFRGVLGFTKDKSVPRLIFKAPEDIVAAFLRGLFTADGSVQVTTTNGTSIRLSSVHKSLLEDVQLLLTQFGVFSYLRQVRAEGVRYMPDSNRQPKQYHCKAVYELILTGDSQMVFYDKIGFLGTHHNERWSAYNSNRYCKPASFLTEVVSVEAVGVEDVYDFTEPVTFSGYYNGLFLRDCSEQFLENYSNCCLGSIDISKHTDTKANAFDWSVLKETIHQSVRFLDNTVEVNTFPLPKLREINLATRRIGLGVMGWADALIDLGIPYDSQEALDLATKLATFFKQEAWYASEKLAQERGPFPEYERSKLKEWGFPPVRHSDVTCIAPTGTISLLAGCSSGIEPHFALAWERKAMWKDQAGTSTKLIEAPAKVARLIPEEALKAIIEDPDAKASVLAEYNIDPTLFRTAMEISPEAHIRMQSAWQVNGITNGVSKTINLANNATIDDVKKAFWLAWETGCKAVTVYRDGSKALQVLEANTKKQGIVTTTNTSPARRGRPKVLQGKTTSLQTGHGTLYVTENIDEDNQPFEVFSTLGKAGGCDGAQLEAISRLISLALQCEISKETIAHQLKGITCCPTWDEGRQIKSVPDAIATALTRKDQVELNLDGSAITKQSFVLNLPENASNLAIQRSNELRNTQVPVGGSTTLYEPLRGIVEDMSRGPANKNNHCPDCYENLQPLEGCWKCINCGWSKCE